MLLWQLQLCKANMSINLLVKYVWCYDETWIGWSSPAIDYWYKTNCIIRSREATQKLNFFFLQWHALDRAEQAKYYEMARKEKELHMQLYPGWSARDNYASHTKKKRKKKDGTPNKGIVQTPSILIKYFFLLKAMHI